MTLVFPALGADVKGKPFWSAQHYRQALHCQGLALLVIVLHALWVSLHAGLLLPPCRL